MGRNKEIRKKIVGCQGVVTAHEEKIRGELMNAQPREERIAGWRREIEAQKKRIALLTRRLEREW